MLRKTVPPRRSDRLPLVSFLRAVDTLQTPGHVGLLLEWLVLSFMWSILGTFVS
jgi:hypothetical protein